MLVVLNLGTLIGQLSIGVLGVRLARWGVEPIALLRGGYAELWGDKLTEKGTLVPVIHSTGKTPS